MVHKNADGLSRLCTWEPNTNEDPAMLVWTTDIICMDPKFCKAIVTHLPTDKYFRVLYRQLRDQIKTTAEAEGGPKTTYNSFRLERDTGLLFFMDKEGHSRLCIPERMHAEMLKEAHDNRMHGGIDKTYDYLRQTTFMAKMRSVVEAYILGCPTCNASKPKMHKPYGEL